RAAALLWALVFVLGTVGEGFALHPCPHHEGPPSAEQRAAANDAAAHPHHSTHGSEAGVASDQHHGSGPPDCHSGAELGEVAVQGHPDSHDEHSGPCTCGSVCQASAGTAMPAVPTSSSLDIAFANHRGVPAAGDAPALVRPPHSLPFAQAPPLQG